MIDEVLAMAVERHKENCLDEVRLYDGIFELIEQLKKRGVRMAVLTNKDQVLARRIIAQFFPLRTFEYIIGIVENGPVKPGTEATEKIVSDMGLYSSDFLFVGDSTTDMDTAVAASIVPVALDTLRWCFTVFEIDSAIV